jgi:hypothetical protein
LAFVAAARAAYALAYFAGHTSFVTTRRYIHPNMETGRAAMERAQEGRDGHRIGHNGDTVALETKLQVFTTN